MLMRLVQAAFESASWPTEVLTGRYTFKVGNNKRNVADNKKGCKGETSEVPCFAYSGMADGQVKLLDPML